MPKKFTYMGVKYVHGVRGKFHGSTYKKGENVVDPISLSFNYYFFRFFTSIFPKFDCFSSISRF